MKIQRQNVRVVDSAQLTMESDPLTPLPHSQGSIVVTVNGADGPTQLKKLLTPSHSIPELRGFWDLNFPSASFCR